MQCPAIATGEEIGEEGGKYLGETFGMVSLLFLDILYFLFFS